MTWPRRPGVVVAAGLAAEQDRADAGDDQQRAPPVDADGPQLHRHLQDPVGDDQREDAQRHVDVEDVPPAEAVDEEAADQRPDHAGQAEGGAEVTLIAAALARRDHVADDREHQRHQPAAAEALNATERDEFVHALGGPAQHAAEDERDDRQLEDPLAAVQVAGLAPQRRRRGTGQQVDGDHPRQQVAAVEVTDDRRQGGRDDGAVEGGEEQAEHEARHDHDDLPMAERRRLGLACRAHRFGAHWFRSS